MVKTPPKKADHISLKEFSKTQEEYMESILNAANEGCLLHKYFIEDAINEEQFLAGIAFAKLYSLSMRSLGIHNRVQTSSKSWDELKGILYDQFSSRKIEGLWRYILKALDPIYHENLPMKQIIFSMVLTNQPPQEYPLNHIRKTLSYLVTVWEKIESSPYRLGLFSVKEKPIHIRLQ